MKSRRHWTTYLCFGEKRNIARRNSRSLDAAVRFDFTNERFVARVPPGEAHRRETRSLNGPTSHQVVRHTNYRRRIKTTAEFGQHGRFSLQPDGYRLAK